MDAAKWLEIWCGLNIGMLIISRWVTNDVFLPFWPLAYTQTHTRARAVVWPLRKRNKEGTNCDTFPQNAKEGKWWKKPPKRKKKDQHDNRTRALPRSDNRGFGLACLLGLLTLPTLSGHAQFESIFFVYLTTARQRVAVGKRAALWSSSDHGTTTSFSWISQTLESEGRG